MHVDNADALRAGCCSLAFLGIFFSWIAHGTEPQELVARPEIKIGDSWTYQTKDLWTNTVTSSFEVRVTFSNPTVIHVINTTKQSERDATYTAEWNAVVQAGGTVCVPHRSLLKFPVRTGSSHRAKYRLQNSKTNLGSNYDMTVKVLGWEDVEVPAGKFRALKIEANGNYQRYDIARGGGARYVIWYAPQVKRWIKWRSEETDWARQPYIRREEELVKFKLL